MERETRRVKEQMRASGTHAHWLAGKVVEVIEWDHGEPWEEPIVKVRCEGKTTWMNPKDFEERRAAREGKQMNEQQVSEITKEERIRILRELATAICFCGAKKARQQTFCPQHYLSLPPRMRSALYQRFGEGYEEAYTKAREHFAAREGEQVR